MKFIIKFVLISTLLTIILQVGVAIRGFETTCLIGIATILTVLIFTYKNK